MVGGSSQDPHPFCGNTRDYNLGGLPRVVIDLKPTLSSSAQEKLHQEEEFT